MKIKRMLLLLSAMAAFSAFVIPAAAQAKAHWYSHGTGGTILGPKSEAHTFQGTGSLSSTRGPLTNGPCEVHFHGRLWNNPTPGTEHSEGHGEIDSFTITATHDEPCETSGTGIPATCKLATANANFTLDAEENVIPWTVTLKTDGVVEIHGVSFTNRYTGCAGIGIPDNAPVTVPEGTLTGQVVGEEIQFVNAGDLTLGGVTVPINGSVSIPGITAVDTT